MITPMQIDQLETPDAHVAARSAHGLYRAGGIAAALVVALLIVETIAYLTSAAPGLDDAAGWFGFFQAHRFLALIDFGLLELCAMLLFAPMFLALYACLRRASPTYSAIAAALAFVGIAANFGSNPLFPMLTLSGLYSTAASEAARAQFIAVGQAMLAAGALGGIGGSVEGGFPLAVAGLIFSVVMLRSRSLGRGAAYAGLLANGSALAMYAQGAVAPKLGGSPFFAPFLLLSVIWYALMAGGFLRLAQDRQEKNNG